ncbi:caspase family protein (plasmid) [Isosphaeraceae bacterium EP7]
MQNHMRGLATFLGLLCFLLLFSDKAVAQSQLHVILAADTISPDIKDDMESNIYMLIPQFKKQVPEARLKLTVLDKQKLNQKTILRTIAMLNVGADDAIVFMYCGHGYYEDVNQGTFIIPPSDGGGRLYRTTVQKAIQAKQTRLCVTIFDCCSVGPNGPPGVPMAPVEQPPTQVSPLFQSLFFNSSGTITMVSSSPGEYALCGIPHILNNKVVGLMKGSLFTGELTWLLRERSNESLRWDEAGNIIRRRVSQTFKVIAKNGVVTLSDGGRLEQQDQTVVVRINGIPY